MKRLALLFALVPMAVFGAISGQWKATVLATDLKTQQKGSLGIYVTLSQNGNELTGTANVGGPEAPIQNASISGTTLSFSVQHSSNTPVPPKITKFVLTPSGADLVGTVTLGDGEKLNVTFTPARGTK